MAILEVWGGAGEHGRSCYWLESEEASILLDCGVHKQAASPYPLLDKERVEKLSTVFLSHAHEDHSMGLPLLYELGYEGVIWTTRETVRQLPAYFDAWHEHVRQTGNPLPYGEAALQRITYRFIEDAAPAGQWFEAASGITACWGPSGHLAGGVWLLINLAGKQVFYSGDYSSESWLLPADLPAQESVAALDLAIVDAAYGRQATQQQETIAQLNAHLKQASSRGGHALLPVPIYGRGLELAGWLAELYPHRPIYCDVRLRAGFEELASYRNWCYPQALASLERLVLEGRIRWIEEEQQQKQVLSADESAIVFVADAQLQSHAARSYYNEIAADPRHMVIFTGHLYEGSFGHQLYEQNNEGCQFIKLLYKVHQGLPDVTHMLRQLKPVQAVLVHAERKETDALVTQLHALGQKKAVSLGAGDSLYW